MRLVLRLDGSPLEFCERNAGGPHPYLDSVGTLRVTARAGDAIGIAATESSSLTVTLDNCERRAATDIGRPLRVDAEVYDDADELFFSGIVTAITYRRMISLEIDA